MWSILVLPDDLRGSVLFTGTSEESDISVAPLVQTVLNRRESPATVGLSGWIDHHHGNTRSAVKVAEGC